MFRVKHRHGISVVPCGAMAPPHGTTVDLESR